MAKEFASLLAEYEKEKLKVTMEIGPKIESEFENVQLEEPDIYISVSHRYECTITAKDERGEEDSKRNSTDNDKDSNGNSNVNNTNSNSNSNLSAASKQFTVQTLWIWKGEAPEKDEEWHPTWILDNIVSTPLDRDNYKNYMVRNKEKDEDEDEDE